MATIVIDPGHFESYNPGICPGYYEGNTMLKLAEHLGALLTAMGATVRYTRTTNEENPSLAQRGGMAANADLFISLHSDASDNENARGVTSFYSVQQPDSEPFATSIGNAAANVMGNPFRGSLALPYPSNPALDYFGVLRAAVSAGAQNAFLIEHGFHTNMEDCLFLSDENNLKRIAAAEAAVIAQYFDLELSCVAFYTVEPGDSLYHIARKFYVFWQTIATANRISYPYTLTPGQLLAIPYPASTGLGCQFLYTIRPGDTLYTIAQKYNLRWQDIASYNNITYPYTLIPGERIVIPVS